MLVGDPADRQEAFIPMGRRKKNGTWPASLRLTPGSCGFRFLVDRRWMNEPACPGQVHNPFGSQNALVQID